MRPSLSSNLRAIERLRISRLINKSIDIHRRHLVFDDSNLFAAASPIGCKSRRRLRARGFYRYLCRVPRTRTSHASGSRLSRDDPAIFSLPLASLGPRKTIATRPCPSDFQLQILWLLTNPSQARDLGSSVRRRLMNLVLVGIRSPSLIAPLSLYFALDLTMTAGMS